MEIDLGDELMSNLRKISRAIELNSKALLKTYGLTGPQLALLHMIARSGRLSVSALANKISLSQATVTSILSRLEQQAFVTRARSSEDKRMVYIDITDKTKAILDKQPSPLHGDFSRRFKKLANWEQTMLLSSIQRIAMLMDVQALEAEFHE
jgi:DNA-binding MarR family transcriptional regulator